MNPQPGQSMPVTEDAEPRASLGPAPVWLMVLLLVLLFGGMVYFDGNSGWFEPAVYVPYHSMTEVALYQPPSGEQWIPHGKAVYDLNCAPCHDATGSGHPNQAPPFAGSEWVLGSPNRLVRIPLYGLAGPITVKGQQYSFPVPMPAMGAPLPPEDLADVLSYMRQAWGNKAGRITAEQVKAVKAAVGSRAQFTPEEVQQVQ